MTQTIAVFYYVAYGSTLATVTSFLYATGSGTPIQALARTEHRSPLNRKPPLSARAAVCIFPPMDHSAARSITRSLPAAFPSSCLPVSGGDTSFFPSSP
jgi:hypothetical protein